jgi:hypothetical protein
MSGLQLFNRKINLLKKVSEPFLLDMVSACSSFVSASSFERFFLRYIHVFENNNVKQNIENQHSRRVFSVWRGFFFAGSANPFKGRNNWYFTTWEYPDSKDNSLFLSPPLLLTVRGLPYSLFHTMGK